MMENTGRSQRGKASGRKTDTAFELQFGGRERTWRNIYWGRDSEAGSCEVWGRGLRVARFAAVQVVI